MNDTLLNRMLGGLLTLAAGDALGATTEFMDAPNAQSYLQRIQELDNSATGFLGGGWLNLEPGEVTDDTAMTLAVAEGIVENPRNPYGYIGDNWLTWFNTNPPDVGNITRTVITLQQSGMSWKQAAKEAHRLVDYKSAGNGALMRCLPIAYAYQDQAIMDKVTSKVATMTHYDPKATSSCLIYNRIINHLLNGEVRQQAVLLTLEEFAWFLPYLDRVEDLPPDGFTFNTLAWALHHFLTEPNSNKVIEAATNMGGDADTIAAVAGGLAGTYWGVKNLATHYRNTTAEHRITQLIPKLLTVRGELR